MASPWKNFPRQCLPGTALQRRVVLALASACILLTTVAPAANTAPVSSGSKAAPSAVPHTASRAITLAPHLTELVYAAGAGDKIVATVNSSNYPPESLDLPHVGDGLSINAEQLLTLQPDLIIGWQNSLAMQRLTPILAELDIAVVYSEPRRLDDIPRDIERIGKWLGTQNKANPAARDMRDQLAALRQTYAHRSPVSVFIEVGTGPLYTLGNDTLTNDALATCGGINVFRDSPLVAPAVTVESVLARDPDVVIITRHATEHITQRTDYWHGLRLRAARQHHVFGMNPDALLRPGPRLIEVLHNLCTYLDRARAQDEQAGLTRQ